ncbi:MAG: 2-hydroxyacid dehydrogenase [Gammaproteobacteria bacterium]
MRLVFLDAESVGDDLDLNALRATADECHLYPTTGPADLADRLAGADIVVTNKVLLDRHALESADSLKLVCVIATGTNNVDLDAARERGIPVCNVRNYGAASVAQHVMGLILSLATRQHDYHQAAMDGRWGQARHFCLLDFPIMELPGKTLGIVGHGDLGRAVAAMAEGIGMKVLVSARVGSESAPVGRVVLEEMLPQVDVLSLHCPLTDQTRDLMNAERIALMKPGALLINAARGGVVNEQALADALRSGHLGGAGVDVLTEEPPVNGNVLLDESLPNLIVTPHVAWATREARQRCVDLTVANIEAWQAGSPSNLVN